MTGGRVGLWAEWLEGRGGHGDLELRIGSHRHRFDSYYLAIDDSPTARGPLGARLARLLDQWIVQVQALQGRGGTAYLPYDFSDECTAWLRVSSEDGEAARVEAGWSLIEGYGILPSDYLRTLPEITDFAPIAGARTEWRLADLLGRVAHLRDGFAGR